MLPGVRRFCQHQARRDTRRPGGRYRQGERGHRGDPPGHPGRRRRHLPARRRRRHGCRQVELVGACVSARRPPSPSRPASSASSRTAWTASPRSSTSGAPDRDPRLASDRPGSSVRGVSRPAPADLLEAARSGDRSALARLLSLVERGGDDARSVGRATHGLGGAAYTVGITGAPGAGKSTLTSAARRPWCRAADERVAVLAIDPSSPFTGGAILGDRVRMCDHAARRRRVHPLDGHPRPPRRPGRWPPPRPCGCSTPPAARGCSLETVGRRPGRGRGRRAGRHHGRGGQPGLGRRRAGQQGRAPRDRRRVRDQQGRPPRRRRDRAATSSACSTWRRRATAGGRRSCATTATTGEGVAELWAGGRPSTGRTSVAAASSTTAAAGAPPRSCARLVAPACSSGPGP